MILIAICFGLVTIGGIVLYIKNLRNENLELKDIVKKQKGDLDYYIRNSKINLDYTKNAVKLVKKYEGLKSEAEALDFINNAANN